LNQLAELSAVPVLGLQFIEPYGQSVGSEDVAVFVSNCGETKDVLDAVKVMRQRKGQVLGVLNVLDSALMHQGDVYLPLACGYEISSEESWEGPRNPRSNSSSSPRAAASSVTKDCR
jgi:glucosamine 6-phosphate synthetase-like amidotransferase/phosphosugar isomerase protein